MQKIIPWRRVSLHPFCRRRDFEQRFDGRCRCCCCCWCCCCCCLCCCYCCWYQSRWWRRCSSQRQKRFGPFSFSVLIAGSWRLNLVAVVRRHHVVGLHRLRQRRCRQDANLSCKINSQSSSLSETKFETFHEMNRSFSLHAFRYFIVNRIGCSNFLL